MQHSVCHARMCRASKETDSIENSPKNGGFFSNIEKMVNRQKNHKD